MTEMRKLKNSCRLLALFSQNWNSFCDSSYTLTMSDFLIFWCHLHEKMSQHQCNFSHTVRSDTAAGSDIINSALSYQNMFIHSYYSTSLCITINQSQYHLSIIRKVVKSWAERSDDYCMMRQMHDFKYSSLHLSEDFRQTDKLTQFRSFSWFSVSAVNPAASAVQSTNPSRNEGLIWSCHLKSAQGHASKMEMTCAVGHGKNSPSQRIIQLRHLGHSLTGVRPHHHKTFLQLAVVLQWEQTVFHGVSVFWECYSEWQWWCDDKINCVRIWTLLSS